MKAVARAASRWVAPEINDDTPGGVLFVGRDPGSNEMQRGRPFVGQAGECLERMLHACGISRTRINIANVVGTQPPSNDFSRHDRADVERGLRELDALVLRLRPNVIVAMGNEAAWACVGVWPGARDGSHGSIFGARDIVKRRGYMWGPEEVTLHGAKVLTTLHPSAVMRDMTGISEMLVIADIAKAWGERHTATLVRPCTDVTLVRSAHVAEEALRDIAAASAVACDIEITGDARSVRCVGIATSPERAWVFMPPMLHVAYNVLRDASVRKVWQNGQFDLHFLLTRAGVRVEGPLDDTIVAWHSRWPEIAGASVDIDGAKRGSKSTRKSLAFFASLYSNVAWWKEYDTDEVGMALLCGKDCCLTYATHLALQSELREHDLIEIYNLTMRRVWPVAEMQARGLGVDEGVRQERIRTLAARHDEAEAELREIARPLFEAARERVPKPHLIWHRTVCPCCRNGKGKRHACTSCADLPTNPNKAQLLGVHAAQVRASALSPTQKAVELKRAATLKIAQLKQEVLKPCAVCNGEGAWETYAFNPASSEQMGTLLYDVLKLPRRAGVDEATLKGLLGQVHALQGVAL